ncbi:hypothetical protein MBAV_003262 [Candidatus Magnetobacterium bavaricum]|uniref:Uncharacterized protein n=1 Tax=Candidatus Magnetobacterium bavaricum TaxID=29290 RepID=A0A0F3GV43_9BACT|nr:hypothetical protein MBAV_003262 [Candidatus Magnetobacterium bavaricum]
MTSEKTIASTINLPQIGQTKNYYSGDDSAIKAGVAMKTRFMVLLLFLVFPVLSVADNDLEVTTYFELGNVYYKKGDYVKAISEYTKCIKMKPNLSAPYNNRAMAYVEIGGYTNYYDAINDFTKAIQLNPSFDEDAYTNRGITYGAVGNYTKAIDDFTQVITKNPKNSAAYLYRGKAYMQGAFSGDKERDVNRGVTDIRTAARLGDSIAKKFLQDLGY